MGLMRLCLPGIMAIIAVKLYFCCAFRGVPGLMNVQRKRKRQAKCARRGFALFWRNRWEFPLVNARRLNNGVRNNNKLCLFLSCYVLIHPHPPPLPSCFALHYFA